MQYTVQYNVLLHGYTRNTRWVLWLLTGKYDRVLVRDIHGSLHGLRPNKSLTYSRELTGSNICTDWSLYDQYIVSSDRDANTTGLLKITMPSSRSVLWTHFKLQDGELFKQIVSFNNWFLVNIFLHWIFYCLLLIAYCF